MLGGPPVATELKDYLLAPLRVHCLSAKDAPEITTTLNAKDVTRILAKMNRVWAQAGLHWYLESLVNEAAANPDTFLAHGGSGERFGLLSLLPEASKAPDMFHV